MPMKFIEVEESELGELRRDAARYRFLRGCTKPNEPPFWAICPPAPSAACASGEELDAMVDAAISEGHTEGGENG